MTKLNHKHAGAAIGREETTAAQPGASGDHFIAPGRRSYRAAPDHYPKPIRFSSLLAPRFSNLLRALVLAPVLLAAACGGGGDQNPVPGDSTLSLSPTDITWEITPAQEPVDPNDPASPLKPCAETDAFSNQNTYNDQTFSISLVDSQQRPLGDVDLQITVDLSGTTFANPNIAVAPIRVYDDRNGNGIADDPEELVSGMNGAGFFTKTGEFSGNKRIIVRVNLACPYRATLYAFAELVSAQAVINVTEKQ